MSLNLKKIRYAGLDNCLELSNGTVKAVVSVGFGPRVLFYGFVHGQNVFHNFTEQIENFSRKEWQSYGGHRLWHAPEAYPRTYYCDVDPVDYVFEDGVLSLDCRIESTTALRKHIDIIMEENSSKITLDQVIENCGIWDVELSAWGISAMAAGTRVFIPQEPFVPHGSGDGETFAPARTIAVWPFTDMSDPRLSWQKRYIGIREDGAYPEKIKIGVFNTQGFAVADTPGGIYIKRHEVFDDVYPDMGCNEEFFTMPGFVEMESLSPLACIAPGEEVQHVETWELLDGKLPEEPDKIAEFIDGVC